MFQNQATKCRIRKARCSYLHVLTPYIRPGAGPNDIPKYQVTLLIPKTDVKTKADLDAAIEAATQAAVKAKWNGYRPPQIPQPIWDGDGVRNDGSPFGPECKGMWVLTASTNAKGKDGSPKPGPQVVMMTENGVVPADPMEIYSGMYASVTVNFTGYAAAGKKGIGCYLGNICKIADGEPLGNGRTSAEDDFGDLEANVDPITGEPV